MKIEYLKLLKCYLLLIAVFLLTFCAKAQNMERYITLNVTKDSLISIQLATDSANTPVKIVSGDSTYNTWTGTRSYKAAADTMTIYGDVDAFYCDNNNTNITGIDASNNTALTFLYCMSNQLTSLDVSGCTALRYLYCYDNQLTSLDVSGCSALTELQCYSNQLRSLDVSGCSALTELQCYSNQLRSLDVSGCSALEYLSCYDNQLTSLDVSGCSALEYLTCYENQLTSLDVSGCTALEYLYCYGNPFTTAGYDSLMCSLPDRSGIAEGFFWPLKEANDANSTVFAATNATNATAKNWYVLYAKGGTIPATSGNYDCSGVNMSRYITLNVTKDADISIQLATDSANTPVRIVSGDSTYNITAGTSLTGTRSYKAAANTMTIYGDVRLINCSDNRTKVTGIDASNNTTLIELACRNNALTSIDVSKNTALRTLNCGDNKLTSLDISQNVALCTLYCYSNQLTSLDVSKNTALTRLYCDNNQLISLDVSKNTALISLICSRNQLTSLDVSGCTALEDLSCFDNQLTSLDVSGCSALYYLDCSNNKLTSLDVSACSALEYLYCSNNKLTSLDVSACSALMVLSCYGNPFTTEEYDKIMCSLPDRSGNTTVYFIPLYNSSDTNVTVFMATNATNATAKNWIVEYNEGGDIPATSGTYDCRLNMSRYITLNVTKDADISIQLATNSANTLVRIVSGDSVYDFTTTSTSLTNITNYLAEADTMTIYGDVTKFYCDNNNTNITGIDASNNTALVYLSCHNNQLISLDVSNNTSLTSLYCNNNQLISLDVSKNTALIYLSCGANRLTSLDVSACSALTYLVCEKNRLTSLDVSACSALTYLVCEKNQLRSLDVSNNTALMVLSCYGNPFTTGGYDSLMCSLPDRSGTLSVNFYPLYDANDTNSTVFAATNATNATAKNWNVQYSNNSAIPATTGDYECPQGSTPEDTTSILEIKLSNIELHPNPTNSILNIKNATDNVQIFDIAGRVVMNIENKETNLLQINVSNLAKGMYFVKVGNYTTKFVKE